MTAEEFDIRVAWLELKAEHEKTAHGEAEKKAKAQPKRGRRR